MFFPIEQQLFSNVEPLARTETSRQVKKIELFKHYLINTIQLIFLPDNPGENCWREI